MLVEIDPTKDQTLKIAERLLSDSESGKKTIKIIKKAKKKKVVVEVLYD